MNSQDPLARLRDIHLPETGGWWPPAPGWWLLAALALIAAVIALAGLLHHQRRNRWKRAARAELKQLGGMASGHSAWFDALNALLKRVARQRYPQQHPETLTGASWIEFLLATAPADKPVDRATVEAMVTASWRPDGATDPEPALTFARHWLEAQA
ncbi:MAG TPA: DUF4381 domain-containing protein [Marinobacter sp.]|jgi:hypothetical protein|nr:DUF4381 domain-containing protein [Marinobacter sp.]